MHVRMHACMLRTLRMCVLRYADMHVCMYYCACAHVCMCVCGSLRQYAYMCVHDTTAVALRRMLASEKVCVCVYGHVSA